MARSIFLVSLCVLIGGQAHAGIIAETSVGTFRVSTVSEGSSIGFAPSAQPWWGDQVLAEEFVQTVGLGLGLPNGDESGFSVGCGGEYTSEANCGPLFAYELFFTGSRPYLRAVAAVPASEGGFGMVAGVLNMNNPGVTTYAVATSVPEPSALAIASLGLLGIWYRRRKLFA